jgi:hypothetical protein
MKMRGPQVLGLGFLLLVLLFRISVAVAGTPSVHEKLAHRLVAAADSALIQYGYCIDKNDCTKKEYAFWSLTTSSASLDLYNVNDIRVISAVVTACLAEYENSGRRIFITALIYREKFEDVRGVIKPLLVSPYIKLYLRGDQQ